MTEAKYLISTEHDPTQGEHVQWTATVTRIEDGKVLKHEYASTEASAVYDAQEYICLLQTEPQAGHVYPVSEDGVLLDSAVPEPQSVKA